MKKASIGKRIGSFMIDHVIITLITIIPSIILGYPENMNSIFPILMIIVFILGSLKDIFNGRGIGKRITGLYVRDCNDLEVVPVFYNLIIRNFFLFIWPIEFLVLLIDKDNRRIGDRLAKTQVVEN